MLAWRRVSTLTCLHRSCGQLDPTTVFWSDILRRPFWFMFVWFSRWNFVFWPYPQSAMTMKNCNERCYVAAESLYGSGFLFAFAFVVEMVRRKGDMKWGWRQQLGMRQHGSTSESVMIEWITSSQDFWSNSRWSDDFVLVRNVFLFSVKRHLASRVDPQQGVVSPCFEVWQLEQVGGSSGRFRKAKTKMLSRHRSPRRYITIYDT